VDEQIQSLVTEILCLRTNLSKESIAAKQFWSKPHYQIIIQLTTLICSPANYHLSVLFKEPPLLNIIFCFLLKFTLILSRVQNFV